MAQYKSEDDKLWVELFKLALTARVGLFDPSNLRLEAEHAVLEATTVANAALPYIKARMVQADANAPLFAPLVGQHKQKRKEDEEDSAFGVTR